MLQRILALALAAVVLTGCGQSGKLPDASSGDQAIAQAYREQRSGVQVTGSGVVTRILSDDNDGGRHQRFIIELPTGQTLLIAHNIDVAPRVDALMQGDTVEFNGVYEYNDEGGVVHWTHHDPDGAHEPGWLRHDGMLYQ